MNGIDTRSFVHGELQWGKDSQLADGVDGHLLELHPPPQLLQEGLQQPGPIVLSRDVESEPKDLLQALVESVLNPVASDSERDEDLGQLTVVTSLVLLHGEVIQVDLDELLTAEEKTGG